MRHWKENMSRAAIAGMMLAVPLAAMGADVYKWSDENGKVHYGKAPPSQQAATPVEIHPGREETPEERMIKQRNALDLQRRAGEGI